MLLGNSAGCKGEADQRLPANFWNVVRVLASVLVHQLLGGARAAPAANGELGRHPRHHVFVVGELPRGACAAVL